MAAGPEHVPRDFELLGLRRFPGPAHECALSSEGRQCALRAYAQRLRRCRRPRADRDHGELPERGRLDRGARQAATLYGRHEENRENEIMRILVTNDDGIHAPGLKVCEDIAHALSDDVWVV